MKILAAVLIVLLALPSLLILIPAPLNVLWLVKLGATELGIWLVIPLLSLSLYILSGTRIHIFGYSGIIATIVYLIPLIKAVIVSYALHDQLEKAYGNAKTKSTFPINFIKLLGLAPKPNVDVQTIMYHEVEGQKLSLDVYTNKPTRPQPCVISVHGGSWSSGDNKMFVDFNKILALQGYIVADVNYRLAPSALFPAQEHDILQSIKYLKSHATQLQIDTNQIFLMGRSAGGQIAAITAFHLGKTQIKGLICFYTPFDMVWGYSHPGNPLILDSRKVLRTYLGGSFDDAKANFYAASPVHQVTKDAPPILMIHGEADEMVAYEHNLRLIYQIKGNGTPYSLLSLPYATHGCDYFNNSHSAQMSTYAIEYFLKKYTL
jgi:acetyl esterase/lipase